MINHKKTQNVQCIERELYILSPYMVNSYLLNFWDNFVMIFTTFGSGKTFPGCNLTFGIFKIIFEGLFYFWSRKTFMTYCHASMHCAGLFPFPKVHSHLWHFIPKAIFCTVRSAYQLNHEVKRWGTGKHWTTRMVRTQNGLEQSKNKITNPEAVRPTYIYHYHSVIQKRVKYGLPI